MKRICKKLTAVFCALMLVSGSVFVTNVLQAEADTYNELFRDDFNSYGDNPSGVANKNAMLAKGWNSAVPSSLNNTTANYNRGAYYRIPYTNAVTLLTSNVSGANQWTDYSVEATLQYELAYPATDPENAVTGTTTAAVLGRANAGSTNGYYLEMVKGSITAKGATLRLRRDSTNLSIVTINSLSFGTDFQLKMQFDGTVIYGYYNGELKITYDTKDDATKYTSGYAGIRKTSSNTGGNVIFDDFLVSQSFEMSYPDGYYYYNDFSSSNTLKQEGWAGSGTKVEETYSLPSGGVAYLTNVVGSSTWSDYIVEADAKIVSGTAAEGYASIVARSTNTTSEGYEYRMYYHQTNGTSLVLYKRNGNTKTLGTYYIDFELDTYYKLTMSVCENNIMCWFGDTLVFDYVDTDSPYLTGYTGIRSPGAATNLSSVYDNYAVREYVEPEVVYPDGYFYYNDFESAKSLQKQGWINEGTKTDGAYILNAASANYLTDVKDSAEWTDYVVEADVILHEEGEVGYASIVARSSSTTKDGYEYRLTRDASGTYLQLYKRGSSGGKINGTAYKFSVSVVPGEWNHMKMVVQGYDLLCYFNGMKVFEVTDTNTDGHEYAKGYAGVRSPGGDASSSYDNYAVREILESDIVTEDPLQKPAGDIWFYDDFTDDTSFTERGWHTDDVQVYNSSVNLNGRLVVDGIEGAKTWSNYEVEAVVSVDKAAGLIGEATTGWAAVCTRTISSTTGYEFGIITSSSSAPYLRLYDRAKKENIAVDKTVAILDGDHTLTMACVGNVITCYFDGALIFTAQNDSARAGYAAIRSSGYPTYYKNFTVRTVTTHNALVPSTVTSPATGQVYGTMTIVSFGMFVVSACGLIVTLCYRRRETL